MEEGLIKRLMSSIKCSSCGQRYETYDVDVLGHNEDIWFLQVRCTSCQAQSLVAAIIKESQRPELVGNHSESETKQVCRLDTVTTDDVLNMHNFLKGFDGDFSHLFGRSNPRSKM